MERDTHATNHGSVFRIAGAVWRRRKWLAIITFLVPFSAVVSVVLAMPNLYRATSTVLIKQQSASEAAAAGNAGELESRLQAISEEILSRSRLQDLIVRFDLYPRLRKKVSSEEVIQRMRRDIRLERKEVALRWGYGSTVAFTLSYQGWEPETVARVVNTLASFYVEENERVRPHQASGVDVLTQLKRQLTEQRTQFNDQYPDIVRLKAEIAALERERQATRAPTSAPGMRASNLPMSRDELESRTAKEQHMQDGTATSRSQSDAHLRQKGEQFRVLDPAIAPSDPIAPNRIRLVLMGLVLAIGLATGAVMLAEQFDTSFHRMDELWAFTKLPILASVPRIVTRADTWYGWARFGVASILVVTALAFLIRVSYLFGQSGEQLVWMLVQRGT